VYPQRISAGASWDRLPQFVIVIIREKINQADKWPPHEEKEKANKIKMLY
jgi:hypothetical protein